LYPEFTAEKNISTIKDAVTVLFFSSADWKEGEVGCMYFNLSLAQNTAIFAEIEL
jgi:hypothetical protein